jgi:DNA primase catalytic subunit
MKVIYPLPLVATAMTRDGKVMLRNRTISAEMIHASTGKMYWVRHALVENHGQLENLLRHCRYDLVDTAAMQDRADSMRGKPSDEISQSLLRSPVISRHAMNFSQDQLVCTLHMGSARVYRAEFGAVSEIEKETVLDIDVNDYDRDTTDGSSRRFCSCTGKKTVCSDCWLFLEMAAFQAELVMRKLLPGKLGDEAFMWCFSGKRGVHGLLKADLCDRDTSNILSRIVDYISHPLTLPSVDEKGLVAEIYAELISRMQCPARDIMASASNRAHFVSFFDNHGLPAVASRVRKAFDDVPYTSPSSVYRNVFDNAICGSHLAMKTLLVDMFPPILDRDVTTKRDNLFKFPFSVHASTMNVSLPLVSYKLHDATLPVVPVLHLVNADMGEKHQLANRRFQTGLRVFREWLSYHYGASMRELEEHSTM